MIFHTKQEAVYRMNQWGAEKRPFLFFIDYAGEQVFIEEPQHVDSSKLLYAFPGHTNQSESATVTPVKSFEWTVFPQPIAQYAAAFQTVKQHILAGNSYLVNLTGATPVQTNLSLLQAFQQAKAPYKLWLKDQFVLFSPEIFVRMSDGFIRSYPMKGTIDAHLPDAQTRIMNDEKEAAEHATIVDLIRNDLSQISEDVQVTRYRYIDEIQTHRGALLQVSSEITGRLPDNWQASLGDYFFRLLPAGSITGAPKKKTLEIIAEAETYSRGFYTGVMGYFDGETLDSAVMIRFIQQEADGSFSFRSGGGITARSEMEKEYNELIQKVYVPIPLS